VSAFSACFQAARVGNSDRLGEVAIPIDHRIRPGVDTNLERTAALANASPLTSTAPVVRAGHSHIVGRQFVDATMARIR
jgi:hypothetical protein